MKTALRCVLVLTVFATVVGALAVSSLVAPEAEAAGCINCRCAFNTPTTEDICVDGPTCSAATGILYAALEDAAGCSSFCQSNLNITMACAPNGGGGYWVCGTLTYQCEICRDLCF